MAKCQRCNTELTEDNVKVVKKERKIELPGGKSKIESWQYKFCMFCGKGLE